MLGLEHHVTGTWVWHFDSHQWLLYRLECSPLEDLEHTQGVRCYTCKWRWSVSCGGPTLLRGMVGMNHRHYKMSGIREHKYELYVQHFFTVLHAKWHEKCNFLPQCVIPMICKVELGEDWKQDLQYTVRIVLETRSLVPRPLVTTHV